MSCRYFVIIIVYHCVYMGMNSVFYNNFLYTTVCVLSVLYVHVCASTVCVACLTYSSLCICVTELLLLLSKSY